MAHFAVTDITGRRHRFAERLNRAGVGWAGAASDRYEVWNEEWRVTLQADGRHRLVATDQRIAVDLVLDPGKPWVAHGENGYSRKGSEPGNASHYYSLTRMPTRGRVIFEDAASDVEGTSWMDHEFGSSFLEPVHLGWDWFSIQLDDGTDLMVFQLRRRDGRRDEHSSGTLVTADGRAIALNPSEFTLTAGAVWQSSQSGAKYPVGWRVDVRSRGLALDVATAVPDQELRTVQSTGVTYWEGSISVRGEHRGRPVTGRGYLEMTGYAGAPMGDLLR
jgi:predicted secreted hydrolase